MKVITLNSPFLQYRCGVGDIERQSFIEVGTITTVRASGYKGGDNVKCEVRAATDVGYGPSNYSSTTTRCTGEDNYNTFIPNFLIQTHNWLEVSRLFSSFQ